MEAVANLGNLGVNTLRSNPYLFALVNLVLALYAGSAAPALPESISNLFDNNIFKTVFMILVMVILQGQSLVTSVLISVFLMVTVLTLKMYLDDSDEDTQNSDVPRCFSGHSYASCHHDLGVDSNELCAIN
jgi:hypothetical protein